MDNPIGKLELIEIIVIAAIVGLVAATLIYITLRAINKLSYTPEKRRRLVQTAIDRGHVVNAKLVMTKDIAGKIQSMENEEGKMCVYEYSYKGKYYSNRIITPGHPTDTMTLYFLKNPACATTMNNIGLNEKKWKAWFACTAIAATALNILILIHC